MQPRLAFLRAQKLVITPDLPPFPPDSPPLKIPAWEGKEGFSLQGWASVGTTDPYTPEGVKQFGTL